ncbi:MAG: LytR family transcriptional regulator [Lachnospiraceae bacterium]|nr:LytR family transcriptional regulator [Lachnospiraceae bacterium]
MKDIPLRKKIGFGIVLLYLCSIGTFIFALSKLGMIPNLYIIIASAAVIIPWILIALIQWKAEKKAIMSKAIGLMLSVLLFLAAFYLFKTESAIASISTTENVKVDKIVVAVLEDDPAQTINDAADYTFGVQYVLKSEEIKEAIADIEENLGKTIAKKELDTMQEQIQQLYAGDVGAVILNEAYIDMMDEEITEISGGIRIIYNYEAKREVQAIPERENLEVESDAFIVYVSGIDVYGPIETNSRSDVNILVVANPTTHKILLVTTPRDFYIPFPGVTGGKRDKLTHAGIYGVDVSMAALGALYDIDPDFYARVNFTSLIKVVDALGGVKVYSEYSFKENINGQEMIVSKGWNYFNGEQALAFCRERKQLSGGDYQRGKNQEAVLKAIIEKLLSPAVLTGASDLLNSVKGNVETNMSMEQIQELIKSQLDDPQPWTIEMMAAYGKGDMDYCYSMPGTRLYVSWPDESSVNSVKQAIQNIMDYHVK